MSVEAFSWALTVPIGGNAKVVLLGLANHAHPDGTETYPVLDTLAEYAHCDRSTARRNVRKLVADGWAIEDGVGPKGQTKYRLPMWRGCKTPPVAPEPLGGGKTDPGGVAPVPPEPSLEPSSNRPKAEEAREDAFPDELPAELHDVAIAAGKILKSTALKRRQTRDVTRAAVGHAVLTYPDRDHVKVARDVENWLLHGKGRTKSCADIVQRYRSFLENTDPPPGPPLPSNGRHSAADPSTGSSTLRQMAADLRAGARPE